MVCQNKIAKKVFKKQPSHSTTPLNRENKRKWLFTNIDFPSSMSSL